jgi:hypothetical protein
MANYNIPLSELTIDRHYPLPKIVRIPSQLLAPFVTQDIFDEASIGFETLAEAIRTKFDSAERSPEADVHIVRTCWLAVITSVLERYNIPTLSSADIFALDAESFFILKIWRWNTTNISMKSLIPMSVFSDALPASGGDFDEHPVDTSERCQTPKGVELWLRHPITQRVRDEIPKRTLVDMLNLEDKSAGMLFMWWEYTAAFMISCRGGKEAFVNDLINSRQGKAPKAKPRASLRLAGLPPEVIEPCEFPSRQLAETGLIRGSSRPTFRIT